MTFYSMCIFLLNAHTFKQYTVSGEFNSFHFHLLEHYFMMLQYIFVGVRHQILPYDIDRLSSTKVVRIKKKIIKSMKRLCPKGLQ